MASRDRPEAPANPAMWIYLAPTLAGAAMTASRVRKDILAGKVRSFAEMFGRTGQRGVEAAGGAAAMTTSVAMDEDLMSKIMSTGSWQRIGYNEAQQRTAIMEAMRKSLWAGGKANQKGIAQASAAVWNLPLNIQAAPGQELLAKSMIQQAYEIAAREGDPSVFARTLQSYIRSGAEPGYLNPAMMTAEDTQILEELGQKYKGRVALGETLGKQPLFAQRIQEAESAIGQALGEKGYVTSKVLAEPAVGFRDVASLRVTMRHEAFGGFSPTIDVPLDDYFFRTGRQGGTVYATQNILEQGAEEAVAFRKYYLKQLTTKLIPELVQKAQAEGGLTRAMYAGMRDNDFTAIMQRHMAWFPNIDNPSVKHQIWLHQQHVGVPSATSAALRGPDALALPHEIFGGLYQQGYLPAISPNRMMSGQVWNKGADYRESMWAYGKDMPWERRPLQFVRNLSPSPQARAMLQGTFGPGGMFKRNEPFLAPEARRVAIAGGALEAPQLAARYAVPGSALEQTMKAQGLAAEQFYVRKQLMGLFGSESVASTKTISMLEPVGAGERGKQLHDWIQRTLRGETTDAFDLMRGERIGGAPATGKGVFSKAEAEIAESLVGAELVSSETGAVRLLMRQRFSPEDYVKIFGSLKATSVAKDDAFMAQLGLNARDEMVAYADEVLKSRGLLREQMASALAEISAEHMAGGNASERAKREINQFLTKRVDYARRYLPNEVAIVRKAMRWGLGAQIGEIAGLLPAAIEKGTVEPGTMRAITKLTGLTAEQIVSQAQQGVRGTAVLSPGSFRSFMGGGGRGSVESRMLSQLMQHKWMVGEENAATAIAGSLMRSMRPVQQEIGELRRAMESMRGLDIGAETVPLPAKIGSLKGLGGKLVDLGVEVPGIGRKLYIPEQRVMRRFREFHNEEGVLLGTNLNQAYRRVLKHAARVQYGATPPATLAQAATDLQNALSEAMGSTIFGRSGQATGAAVRGKMFGSAYLALSSGPVEAVKTAQGAAPALEVSYRSYQKMYKDLLKNVDLTAEDRAALAQRHQRLMRGGTTESMVWRSPTIGKYSAQPIQMRIAGATVTRTERGTRVAFSRESMTQHFVRARANVVEAAEAVIGAGAEARRISTNVDVSPLLGMAADVDDDRLVVALIGEKKAADATRRMLKSGQFMNEYKQFAAEATLLTKIARESSAGAAARLTGIEDLLRGAERLRVGKADVGLISDAMTQAKLATSHYRPAAAGQFNLVAEMLEQQIISSKNIKAGESKGKRLAAAIYQLRQGNTPAAQAQPINELVGMTKEMLGPAADVDISMKMSGKSWNFRFNPTQMWEDVAASMREGSTPEGILTRFSNLAKGHGLRGEYTIRGILQTLEEASLGRSDDLLNVAIMRAGIKTRGPASALVASTKSQINRGLRELGSHVSGWGKPLIWGLGITAAGSMLLGGPKPKPVQPPVPGQGAPLDMSNDAELSGGLLRGIIPQSRDMRAESVVPPGGINDMPAPPGMSTPVAYATTAPPMSYRIRASGRAGSYVPDSQSVVSSLGSVTSGSGMSVTYRDDRSPMTADKIAEMMEGY